MFDRQYILNKINYWENQLYKLETQPSRGSLPDDYWNEASRYMKNYDRYPNRTFKYHSMRRNNGY